MKISHKASNCVLQEELVFELAHHCLKISQLSTSTSSVQFAHFMPSMSGLYHNTDRFRPVDRRHQRPTIPRNEGEVIEQIGAVLAKWGITSTKETHVSFESSVKEVVANCFNATIVQNWEPFDTSVVLPVDTIESLKILLDHNLRQVTKGGRLDRTKFETKDMIKDRYDAFLPFPPFHFVRGGSLVLSRPYKELRLSKEELDPLSRFTYNERPVKEYMLEQFNQAPNDEYPSHFVRALALHEAVNGGHACLSCGKLGCLRWNSALRSDFCNIICDECNSFYSLCCVTGSEKVRKVFKNKSHFRGSYAHFQQLRSLMNEASHQESKMFLLFATRWADPACPGGNKLPLFAAQIMGAQPNMNSDSFSPDRIRIRSNVVFEPMLHGAAWFSVDVPENLNVVELSMEVFNAHFDARVEDKSAIALSVPKESLSARKIEQQIVSLKKMLAQIQSIKGKQKRGIRLQDWELDLLGRESKLVKKLNQL